ncbi:enoyl-CoA hydratase [Streptomyces hainanensis]|uniref:Probable enoyl-CoA hydratase echA8 n=2 Tax=Streptomyces hainanensis TaxID=402648 RepID=A0A4R4TEC6_9ACTN|nr:enoyl-CoA hydratase [Streptomyces hainanensis]
MGGPMAANLVGAGHRVSGHDLVAAALDRAATAGVRPAASAAGAVADAEVVIMMLPAGREVLGLYDEVLGAARPGTLFVDCSTIDVADARAAHDLAAAAGMRALDAPVSGGVVGAEAATLTFMVGGGTEEFEEARTTIRVERVGRAALITLDRPRALNALNLQVMNEVVAATEALDRDPECGCVVITGSAKAFAAGADIKEMRSRDYLDMYLADWFAAWDRLGQLRTPTVAAVAGYALGGCELAMLCDVLLAADTAVFGQPEITLGVIPGIGGSQGLTRAVGKAKAMEMCLTGRTMDAAEAERAGLVSRVVPADELLGEALAVAETVAGMSLPAVMMAKEAVARAFETTLAEGVRFERRLFHAVFATADQKEGMAAFVEKRPPAFRHR